MKAKLLNYAFNIGCWVAEYTPFTGIGRSIAKWAARMEARRVMR